MERTKFPQHNVPKLKKMEKLWGNINWNRLMHAPWISGRRFSGRRAWRFSLPTDKLCGIGWWQHTAYAVRSTGYRVQPKHGQLQTFHRTWSDPARPQSCSTELLHRVAPQNQSTDSCKMPPQNAFFGAHPAALHTEAQPEFCIWQAPTTLPDTSPATPQTLPQPAQARQIFKSPSSNNWCRSAIVLLNYTLLYSLYYILYILIPL